MTTPGKGLGSGGGSRAKRPLQNWAKLKQGKPLALADHGSKPLAWAEEYRSIAVQVEQSLTRGHETKILAITGSDRRCGKSLTSLNLALLLARRGERRVILVEGDLWQPTLRNYLDVQQNIDGLGDILGRGTPVSQAIVSIWGAGLDVIFAGSSGDASDLMTGDSLARLGDELRRKYEIIVVDTPPVMLAAGRSLAGWVDKSLLVVRAGQTRKKSVEDALRILGPDKTLGMILNDVKGAPDRKYGYVSYLSPAGKE